MNSTAAHPSNRTSEHIDTHWVFFLASLAVVALSFGTCVVAAVALDYASTRGRLLANPPEVLQLAGEPGSELRIMLWEFGPFIPEEPQSLRLEFLDPPSGLPPSLDVLVVPDWGFDPIAVLKIPEKLEQEDVTVSGTIFGALLLDNGTTKPVEVPFQLRIAPASKIDLPSQPLLSGPAALFAMLGFWLIAFVVMVWLICRIHRATLGSERS
jgi:hypothetical protein